MLKKLANLVSIVLILASPAYAAEGIYNYRGHMMGSWGMGWMMIVFWGLILIGMVLMIRWILIISKDNKKREKNYLDILKERFASGEIDLNEYEEKKRILRGNL